MPAEKDLVSIIILCCNQLEYTAICLESVLSRCWSTRRHA